MALPTWLKYIIEAAILLGKKKGVIDPNLNKKQ